MITSDYSKTNIVPEEVNDLRAIADVELSNIKLDNYPNLLVFPDSFNSYDRNLGRKFICNIDNEGNVLYTNSIVGFIGRNNTHLSIHSRFVDNGKKDFFLHYMLQKVSKINLFNLQHTTDDDSVFDFLLYLFPMFLKKAIIQGIFRQYVTHKYNDANVRGGIDVNRHIRCNNPFNGKIAYTTREYCYDNDLTQLIRHTIEFISECKDGVDILNVDVETQDAVTQIVGVTKRYSHKERQDIINKNLRPVSHPYYSEYTLLQRLCLQILRHEELKYGHEDNEIYGVLIDAAWLWEEYLAIVLKGKFQHYLKERGKRFYLFDNFQQIIPDYLSADMKIVADAKYIPLNREKLYGEEKTTAIYYKTITYMYRFCSDLAYLFYPHPDENTNPIAYKIKTEVDGKNGGKIIKFGLGIPSNCSTYCDFIKKMEENEKLFYDNI